MADRTCRCGRPETDLPLYFQPFHFTDPQTGGHGSTVDHWFHGCPVCGVTFCGCRRPHQIKEVA